MDKKRDKRRVKNLLKIILDNLKRAKSPLVQLPNPAPPKILEEQNSEKTFCSEQNFNKIFEPRCRDAEFCCHTVCAYKYYIRTNGVRTKFCPKSAAEK